jgi:TRAP-type C4-dicarboxylate transport system permease small subunit
VVGSVYEYHGPPVYDRWAYRVVEWLGLAQLGVMVIASVAVVVLAAGPYRWLGWAAILAVGVLACLVYFGAAMATTGAYL